MTENTLYNEENFIMSYESIQNAMRRKAIEVRGRAQMTTAVLAQKAEINEEKILSFELGEGTITLYEYAKILDVGGLF